MSDFDNRFDVYSWNGEWDNQNYTKRGSYSFELAKKVASREREHGMEHVTIFDKGFHAIVSETLSPQLQRAFNL